MKELQLPQEKVRILEEIYEELERLYADVAARICFSCDKCPDNCCDSYFQHHTYLEWAYMYMGVKELPKKKKKEIVVRAAEYIAQCHKVLAEGGRPQVMCPLNENGRCVLYKHRMLVCRTHGVPATITRPDGQSMHFPGCFRCQEKVKKKFMHESKAPRVERTPFLQRLAKLENELLYNRRNDYPRVNKTIAEMLVEGAPELDEK